MPELSRPTQAELDRMSHAEKDALIAALFDLLGQHERRLRELESQVKKTRRNSSQPPSTDGLQKGPAMPRRPGEKPLGGQPDHPGATRTPVDTPDAVRELRPVGACGYGTGLAGLPAYPGERRQQIEIPEPKPVLTEFRQRVVTCPGCGQTHRGAFPTGVTPNVSFGPRLKADAVGRRSGPPRWRISTKAGLRVGGRLHGHEWIQRALDCPEREFTQADGCIRRWAKIEELEGRYLASDPVARWGDSP
jgi:transposase